MNCVKTKLRLRFLVLAGCLLLAGPGRAALTELYFRAAVTTNTMPDGRAVVMWGLAQDSSAAAHDGTVTVPGPAIALGPGPQDLVIHLTNTLPEPVSLVMPGQRAAMGNPARNLDGRVRSFTHEAPPGGVASYAWSNLQAGTFLYQSGSHPALQVQMGLYGALTKLAGAAEAYPAVPFNSQVLLLFSTLDPDLHDAVAAGNYGPGKPVTSTLHYHPQYFFINGVSYTNGLPPVPAGQTNGRILLRLLNAGIDYHIPTLNGAYFNLIAEDGNPLPYPREAYAVPLAPLKTMDAVLYVATSNVFALYDRRLGLVTSTNGFGGMLTYLAVNAPAPPAAPFVDITNAAPQTVAGPLVNIYGTNNADTIGLTVSNATMGGARSTFAWGNAVSLIPGLNTIVVYGSNSAGAVASDSHAVTYAAAPVITITNADFSVENAVASATIAGTSLFCVGNLTYECYSNALAGPIVDTGSTPAAAAWQLTVNNLVPGPNVVAVFGTNAAGAQSFDTLTITRQAPTGTPVNVTLFSIGLSGGVVNLSWNSGNVGVLACTNRHYSTNPADWFVLAAAVVSPWSHGAASNYPSIYYRLAAGAYTSQYDVGAFTLAIKQSDGVLFRENWVSSPLDFLDASGASVPFKSFDELQVAACLTAETGLLSRRDRVQSQEPVGGDTFTASRGNGVWFVDAPAATNWYAHKMYRVLINPLHTGPDKRLTFVGKVRTAATQTVAGILKSDGVLVRENWVGYPYPAWTSFDQGALATVLTDQSGLLNSRDKVQSQEPVGGDTFTASRGVGAWFYDNPAATNLVAGKGYLIHINPLHSGATTNWVVPKPY